MRLAWSSNAWEDYLYWQTADTKTLQRVNALIRECQREPFRGTGKPEPLKGSLAGWWSRRINGADRLVYRVVGKAPDQTLEIIQCRLHY